jgi:hypothetical protein
MLYSMPVETTFGKLVNKPTFAGNLTAGIISNGGLA